MDDPKVGESSTSSLSPKAPPPEAKPRRTAHLQSSAAFLHHLHTDPKSHHITLSSGPGRHASAPLSGKPARAATNPLGPIAPPDDTTKADAAGSGSVIGTLHGPVDTTLKPRDPFNRTPSSRRSRPSTAPTRPYTGQPPADTTGTTNEDDVESLTTERSHQPREMQIQPADEDDESCLASFVRDENVHNATDAMSMLSVSPDGTGSGRSSSGRNRLIGRAGHLSPSSPPSGSLELSKAPSNSTNRDIGWRDFASNYAAGNFDPNRTPQPPIESISPRRFPSAHSSPGTRYPFLEQVAHDKVSQQEPTSSDTNSSGASATTSASLLSGSTQPSSAPSAASPARSVSSLAVSPANKGIAFKTKSLEAENLQARAKSPLGNSRLALPSYNMAAATMHMASASSGLNASSFAPLNVPSPDKELTDPMANFVSTSATQIKPKDPSNSDPSHGSRYPLSRSMSSAVDPDRHHLMQLPTIEASPGQSPYSNQRQSTLRHESKAKSPPSWQRGGAIMPNIPPATAPVEKTVEAATGDDYFGNTVSPPPSAVSRQASYSSGSSGSQQTVTGTASTPIPFSDHPDERDEPLTRTRSLSPPPDGAVPPSHMNEVYDRFGWLPAPIPPDEMARRRALYRFNILRTAPDVNFDRIAHMAKLVFASKIVMIALVDGDTQWHKSQAGPALNEEVPRAASFCAHTILSKNDEPLVILDTAKDWRFAESPYVTGPPHIRFYAGAPLRTADGYNLGSLCLLDDKPHEEFTPRQRLILKEFTAIAMREMELWRDKLQLRVRDRIQTSMEKFTRECLEMDPSSVDAPGDAAVKMETVWNRAATLSCSTLDMEECTILDLGAFELTAVETADGPKSVYRADPYNTESEVLERMDDFGAVGPLPILASTNPSRKTVELSPKDHEKISEFLRDARDGRIYEHRPPSWIASLFPEDLRYAMVIPVFGINQQAFTLICVHTTKASKQFLEGYELQFLRAIGVILLSAVLRRRMVLADKAKSILISSVSHELRTPLHGILAAAELLSDTDLDQNQISFLRTVQSCGNSLIETVNHVLDFTKLSGGNNNAGGKSLKLSKVNLATLIEQTVEGCWVGQRARTFLGDADVGSYYAPDAQPKSQRPSLNAPSPFPVEIVVDIAHREKGWNVKCEKGGLRRVLMNLIGNSLKFTTEGYIQVTLRELPHEPGSKTIPLEMAVIDTGKGIGKEFLKEQLFHPFSQENPLQTGTGLGLAIVNSIVRSEDVNGKVDVWSSEGMGTEIRVSLDVEVIDDEEDSSSSVSSASVSAGSTFGQNLSVSLIGFDSNHRGHALSLDVLSCYACLWHFDMKETGDIIIVHEDESLISAHMNDGKPIIFLTGTRRGEITSLASKISKNGGFFHIVYKPIGPSGLRHALQAAVHFLESPPDTVERPAISRGSSGASEESASTISELSSLKHKTVHADRLPLQRRRSEETEQMMSTRPTMAPRGLTYHHGPSVATPRRVPSSEEDLSPSLSSPSSTMSTISLADGGVLLKAAAQPPAVSRRNGAPRVLVVEDNVINRRVLAAFLKKRGYEWAEAYNGAEGVELFKTSPPNHWDAILMDISMPIMNGHDATRAIRRIEAQRRSHPEPSTSPNTPAPSIPGIPGVPVPPMPMAMAKIPIFANQTRAKIFALTGLATPDDKREAFSSGVDGYLVKPVSLASLDQIFKRIGFA